MRTLLKTLFVIWTGLMLTSAAWAQDEAEAIGKLTPQQEQTYREILAKPIDEKAMYSTQIVQYKEKARAAMMLGEIALQEKNLLAWSRIDPDGLWSLRGFYSNMGRQEEAIKVSQNIIEGTKFPPSLTRMYSLMAMDYMRINQMDKAQAAFDKAEEWLKQGNGGFTRAAPGWVPWSQTEFFTFKSIYLLRIGKKAEGMALAKLAVERSNNLLSVVNSFDSELLRTFAKANATRSMGNLVSQQVANGQYIDAQWSMRDALKRAKDNGFNQNHLFVFHMMASDIFAGTGQFDLSLKYAQSAEKIHTSQGYPKASPNWLNAQSKVLRALVGLEQWPDAKAVLADAASATEGTIFSVNNLDADLVAMVEMQTGQYASALARLERDYDNKFKIFGGNHYNTALTAGLLGVAQLKNKQDAAAKAMFVKAHQGLTTPESLTGDFHESAIQKSMTRFVFDGQMKLLAKSAAQSPQDAIALFELADLANNSSVQSALTEAAVRMSINVPGLSDVVRKDQDAKQEFASLITYINNQNSVPAEQRNPKVVEQMRQRMHDIEGLRKDYKAQIQKQFPDYFLLLQPRAPKPEQIAKMLAADEVFVSIQPMRDETYVWTIDAAGKVGFHISPWGEKQTRDAVDRVRHTLDVAEFGARAPRFDEATSHDIYSTFFAPQAAALKDKKHVVVATSGALAKLPFAVLVTQRSASPRSGQDADWFIKQAAISHVPSASGWMSLKKLSTAAHGAEPLMAWGDPQFDVSMTVASNATSNTVVRSLPTRSALVTNLEASQNEAYLTYSKIPPLPETRDEVLALADIMGANPQTDVILGKAASRASVLKHSSSGLLAKKQVVVFATHGLLAGDLPNLSQPALAMASTANPNESPLLTLEDVLSLKLNADWVVLSACNTAGADGKAEEAMSGLARGFFYAGSRSLLVTHWSVESESAKQLTTRTFTAYKQDKQLRRAEALRLAMLETMKTPAYAHPAYWAPYALVGEGGR